MTDSNILSGGDSDRFTAQRGDGRCRNVHEWQQCSILRQCEAGYDVTSGRDQARDGDEGLGRACR